MKSFKLLGKTIKFTDEQLLYFSIRDEYMKFAIDANSKARKEFYDVFNNFSDLYENGATWILGYLLPVVDYAVKNLGKMKYYDLDSDSFIDLMDTSSLRKCINRVVAVKEEIEAAEEERERERAARTEAAGSSWSGGGFGVSGAIKGAATAGALNLGGAALSGAFNMIGRGISAASNAGKLKKFLESEETITSFADTLVDLIFEVRNTFISVAEKNCKNFKIKQLYSSDREKAERIFKNIKGGVVPEDDIIDNITRIIEQYPYISEVYEYLAKNYDDKNLEIETIADFFNYDIKAIKKNKLDEYFEGLPKKTEAEMIAARKAMSNYAKKIGIKDYQNYPRLEKLIIDYDRNERTFNGVEYPSRELAYKHKELYDFFIKLDLDTEEKAIEAKETIITQAEKLEINLEFDKKARTAGGKIFKTREEADIANRHIQLNTYFKSLKLSTEQKAIAARELINNKIQELNLGPMENYEPLENLIKKLHIHEENMRYIELFNDLDFNKIYVYPKIPEDKLASAINSYDANIKSEDVLVLVDDTFLGGCEDGLIITKTHMYFHSSSTNSVSITNPIVLTFTTGWLGTKIFVDGEEFGKLSISDKTALTVLFDGVEKLSNNTHKTAIKKNKKKTAEAERVSESESPAQTAQNKKQSKTSSKKQGSSKNTSNNCNPQEFFNGIKDNKIFISPNIPEKKLSNALTSYARNISSKDVLVLIDDTLMGGAKDGCILTSSAIYAKEFMGEIRKKDLSSGMKIALDGKKLIIDGQTFIGFTMPDESALKMFVKAINKLLNNC